MKTLFAISLIGSVVVGSVASYNPIMKYFNGPKTTNWKFEEIDEGTIISVRNSTGEVKPVQSVIIGAFVSGPIKEIYVDFNDEVKEGDLLAEVDPRLLKANVKRDQASYNARKADVNRIQALLKQSRRDRERALGLQAENKDYISQTEVDQYVFSVMSLEAQLEVAEASVEQAEAALDNSNANLKYTEIVAPIDGIIIDRKIDPGQTLASSFQTPELFILAPDMEKKMHIFASVDEADIGAITKAKENGMRVQFTVDAWPGEVFNGEIEQIRVSSTAESTVVTYPVVVAAPNPDRKLLPGMTATITFDVERHDNILRIATKTLRYMPSDRKLVHEADHDLLDGKRTPKEEEGEALMSAVEKAAAKKRSKKRHVWVTDGDKLRAVEIETGIDDNKFTEVLSGELKVGDKIVTGIEEPKKKGWL